jgi:hypothetical protein
MEDIKINYIIASYSGVTYSRRFSHCQDCLDFQLQTLKNILVKKKEQNLPCLIKRITIIVPEPLPDVTVFKNYYRYDKWKQMFESTKIPIIFQLYQGQNIHHSYDQWLQGIIASINDYTHHIVMEDDYCINPDCIDFDSKLIEIYKEKFNDNIGYLSEKCGYDDVNKHHSWISNGIISSDTLKKINDPLNTFYSYHLYPQIGFSFLFYNNNIPLADYSDYFRVPFWNHTEAKIIDFSNNKEIKEACIVPVEEFLFKE